MLHLFPVFGHYCPSPLETLEKSKFSGATKIGKEIKQLNWLLFVKIKRRK